MATLQTQIANANGGAFTIRALGVGNTDHNLQAGENVWRFSSDTAEVALQLDLRGVPSGIYERSGSVAVRHRSSPGWVGNGRDET